MNISFKIKRILRKELNIWDNELYYLKSDLIRSLRRIKGKSEPYNWINCGDK